MDIGLGSSVRSKNMQCGGEMYRHHLGVVGWQKAFDVFLETAAS